MVGRWRLARAPLHARRCPSPLPSWPARSRVLAAKCALGVRVDALGDVNDEGAIGLESRAKVRRWRRIMLPARLHACMHARARAAPRWQNRAP